MTSNTPFPEFKTTRDEKHDLETYIEDLIDYCIMQNWYDTSKESASGHLYLLRLERCTNIVGSDTGSPSSSHEMIILRNNRHGEIIRVCMGIFPTALGNKKKGQILTKNTSPYFHSTLPVI